MNSKHTPGPWKVNEVITTLRGTHLVIQQECDSPGEVAIIEAPLLKLDRANARLIAAAPELLEACKKALTCGLDSSVRSLIVAAIAKAEGQ